MDSPGCSADRSLNFPSLEHSDNNLSHELSNGFPTVGVLAGVTGDDNSLQSNEDCAVCIGQQDSVDILTLSLDGGHVDGRMSSDGLRGVGLPFESDVTLTLPSLTPAFLTVSYQHKQQVIVLWRVCCIIITQCC